MFNLYKAVKGEKLAIQEKALVNIAESVSLTRFSSKEHEEYYTEDGMMAIDPDSIEYIKYPLDFDVDTNPAREIGLKSGSKFICKERPWVNK